MFPLPEPMRMALDAARAAAAAGEVPVGAVLICAGQVIATAGNAPRTLRDPTAHAEMLVIRAGAAALGRERLEECDLWVTLEPCAMCAGAIAHARVRRLLWRPRSQGRRGGAWRAGIRAGDVSPPSRGVWWYR
jgi:tRNA(adenine34) deaminase